MNSDLQSLLDRHAKEVEGCVINAQAVYALRGGYCNQGILVTVVGIATPAPDDTTERFVVSITSDARLLIEDIKTFKNRFSIVPDENNCFEKTNQYGVQSTEGTFGGEVRNDPVNNPKHYNSHPSGVECIQITEHMGFNLGNAIKYIWRADEKGDALQDLEKAEWYIRREIKKRRSVNND